MTVLILGFSRQESEKIKFIFQSKLLRASTYVLSSDLNKDLAVDSSSLDQYRSGSVVAEGTLQDRNFDRLFLENFHIIMKLATRQQLSYGSLSFDRIEEFCFKLKKSAEGFIKSIDPQVIYTKSYPQFAFEYLIFLCAQAKRIPFVFEHYIPYFNRIILASATINSGFFQIKSIPHDVKESPPSFSFRPDLDTINSTLSSIVELQKSRVIKPMNATPIPLASEFKASHSKNIVSVLYDVIKSILSLVTSRNKNERIENIKRFRITSVGKSTLQRVSLAGSFRKAFLSHFSRARRYAEISALSKPISKLAEPEKKVIYFASQEPEATLLVNGGRFNSNIFAITHLRSRVDADIDIHYRDAPSAFLSSSFSGFPGTEPENMPDWIHRFLVEKEGVNILSTDITKQQLLQKHNTIATVCGTVGFEAALLGLRSFVFSGAWYTEANHPNILTNENWSFETVLLSQRDSIDYFSRFFYSYLENSCPYSVQGLSAVTDRACEEYRSMIYNTDLSGFLEPISSRNSGSNC